MIDSDYYTRLEFLAELMKQNPNKPMRKLQRESLRLYPCGGKEFMRFWLSYHVANEAAKLANAEITTK
jgi:hypothetical protein